ncbi:MAG: hypothetical protein M3542_09925 [Acidobacteriota bacterium]|nr:hypothetical protein [Acidobacteriota bacterium]
MILAPTIGRPVALPTIFPLRVPGVEIDTGVGADRFAVVGVGGGAFAVDAGRELMAGPQATLTASAKSAIDRGRVTPVIVLSLAIVDLLISLSASGRNE